MQLILANVTSLRPEDLFLILSTLRRKLLSREDFTRVSPELLKISVDGDVHKEEGS